MQMFFKLEERVLPVPNLEHWISRDTNVVKWVVTNGDLLASQICYVKSLT